jgi:hypothetical protein
VASGHQQGVGAADGEGDVGVRGGVRYLLGVSAGDPGVLVVVGQDGGVAVAEPRRRSQRMVQARAYSFVPFGPASARVA